MAEKHPAQSARHGYRKSNNEIGREQRLKVESALAILGKNEILLKTTAP